MAQVDLSLEELVRRALARGLASRKFVKLAQSWLSEHETEGSAGGDQAAAAILLEVIRQPEPPAILLGYLSQCLSASLFTARTLIVHLLFLLSDKRVISPSTLITIASLTTANPTGLDSPLPSTCARPSSLITSPPDIGSSTSTSLSSEPVSTLGLVLPLLRQCTTSPTSAHPSMPLVNLVNRLLTLLQPYPAPPLDVGLEAGGLFQSLPEALSVPLRDCLSGLMADLAISQDASAQIPPPAPIPQAVSTGMEKPPEDGNAPIVVPTVLAYHSQVSLARVLALVLAQTMRSDRWTISATEGALPPSNHIAIIKIGPQIAPDPQTFLSGLLQAAVAGCTGDYGGGTAEGVPRWLFLTERLPMLLKWWKDHSTPRWAYPDNLRDTLTAAVASLKPSIATYDTWISTSNTLFVNQTDPEEDSGGYAQPEGWMFCGQQVTLLQRLLELGLLQRTDSSAILPGMAIPAPKTGESLMIRIASAHRSHLRALGHIATYAPGAARALAHEVFATLQACPATPPPENLFVNLAHEPSLLACIGGYINPATWLVEIKSKLLTETDDVSARSDDPQGSLQRFGEGIVFAEAMIAHFDLPLPDILTDARKAIALSALDQTRRSWVDGWIKALFGAEGIEDEIVLATAPASFCRLAGCIIQQTVIASASGLLDSETLQSGLSYFSQPLLSWSLVGIIEWLCSEIKRSGSLSAFHLNILQQLVMSSSFPASTLRMTSKSLSSMLSTTSLEAVFSTSRFDAAGMRVKAASSGAAITPGAAILPREMLRTSLQIMNNIELAPQIWPSMLCESLEKSLRMYGPGRTLDNIIGELLGSTNAFASTTPIVLQNIGPMLLVGESSFAPRSLLQTFIDQALPTLLDSASSPLNNPLIVMSIIPTMCRLLKYSLLLAGEIKRVDDLVDHLIEDLVYAKARPVKAAALHSDKTTKRKLAGDQGMGKEAKRALEALCSFLTSDDELRAKWDRLGVLEA